MAPLKEAKLKNFKHIRGVDKYSKCFKNNTKNFYIPKENNNTNKIKFEQNFVANVTGQKLKSMR